MFKEQSPFHGTYPWVLDFFNFNMHLANESEAMQTYALITKHPPGPVRKG